MAAGALELRAEEDPADGLGQSSGLVAELHVEQFRPLLLRQQQSRTQLVVRLVLGELLGEPVAGRLALAVRFDVRRIAAEEHQIPDVRLLRGETRIVEQPLDELVALLRGSVSSRNCLRLVVGGDGADEIEIDAAEERRIVRLGAGVIFSLSQAARTSGRSSS